MEDAAARAGELLKDHLGRVVPREKAPKDLVSEADTASQKLVYDSLMSQFPDFEFVGEEDLEGVSTRDLNRLDSQTPCWVVDPLDGTINYLHQMPGWGVSIAVVQEGIVQAGVVYDPLLNERFSAVRGGGAFLNGNPISVSGQEAIGQSLIAASLPSRVEKDSPEVNRFVEVAIRSRALRRLGSAALNLAYVGCGRLDAYWATTVNSWDVAAGVLIAQEAGATVTGWMGGAFDLKAADFTIASSAKLHTELIEVLQPYQ